MPHTATRPSASTDQQLGPQLLEAGLAWSSSQHRLVRLAALFAASPDWVLEGCSSASQWIAERLDIEPCTAREWIRIGTALAGLDVIDTAFAERLLSYSKVRTLTRVATTDTQAELCQLAQTVSAADLGRALADWSNTNEDDETIDRRHQRDRKLNYRLEPDGMITGHFRLPPADAASLTASIDAIVMRTAAEPANRNSEGNHASADASTHPSLAQQRADALMRLAATGGGEVNTEVIVHVRGNGCTLDDGTPLTDHAVGAMLPNAFVRLLIHDADRKPINASKKQRFPTDRQKRVVKTRDRCCIDCGRHDLLEYDHVPSFSKSHNTVVEELELRCAICHHARHQRDANDGTRRR